MYNYNGTGRKERRPMKEYHVFHDCMLEAWTPDGVTEVNLQESIHIVIKRADGRKRAKLFNFRRRIFQNVGTIFSGYPENFPDIQSIRVVSEEKLLSNRQEQQEVPPRPPQQQTGSVNIAGFSFPIADEEIVEKLEQTVRSNWLVRQAYVNLLRSHMPRKSDAHRIYEIVSNKIFTHQALQNYYLTVDRQPYFKQATRKAMVNYDIFQGCMLEAWSDRDVDHATLNNSLRAVVMVISRKLRKPVGSAGRRN
ncbi:uncharacterized protein LOC135697342 [Ochlerotatus camptorhynchus]|uniref:uncharacterized protein LOC135697342 n=1 Tax=Ochlerotatus camptorhynchus TaxID=644619 RepID=UPI0031D08C14